MNLIVGVPILNQPEVSQKFLDTLRDNEGESKPPIYIVDNGSDPYVRSWLLGLREGDQVIRNGENEGVVKALNQIYALASKTGADYIFYTHNDVMVYEKGWDDKIARILEQENAKGTKVGVAGFYGAKGIGTPDLYKTPYIIHQLIRLENVSNCNRMDPVHGYRPIKHGQEVEDVAVMDGFSLIVSVELLDKIGGFDRNYPPHHMYDNDICLESLDKGYRNIVISMDAQHLGGRTDVGENWNAPFNKSKAEIHADAHPIFYNKWNPGQVAAGVHKIALPVRVY